MRIGDQFSIGRKKQKTYSALSLSRYPIWSRHKKSKREERDFCSQDNFVTDHFCSERTDADGRTDWITIHPVFPHSGFALYVRSSYSKLVVEDIEEDS